MGNGKFNSAFLLLWMALMVVAVHDVKATLRTTFLEDICFNKKTVTLSLRYQPTGILMSLPQTQSTQDFDCEVILSAPIESSIVLSIFRYEISPNDLLTIEDSDRFKVTLTGFGSFKDEKKSFISDGRMVIRYRRNTTEASFARQGFQFTFTAAQKRYKNKCFDNEFQCNNHLCILREYVCDGHNHCGDGSDQKICVPKDEGTSNAKQDFNKFEDRPKTSIIMISIIGAAGVVVFIIVIVFIVVVVRRSNSRKPKVPPTSESNNENSGGNISLQSVSSTVPQQPSAHTDTRPSAPPAPENEGFSFYNRVRRSLRGVRSPKPEVVPKETVTSEVYQVPSMYPNLDQREPASSEGGIENPEFKIEE